MPAITAITSILFFIIALSVSGITCIAKEVLATVRDSISNIRNSGISDEEREKLVQQASIILFKSFLLIFLKSILVFLFSALPIYASDFFNISETHDTIAYLSRWDVILITSVLICLVYIGWLRLNKSYSLVFQMNYSIMDRLLHRIAFSSKALQITAADIEKNAFGSTFNRVTIEKPIFITSLPRAGTTLMLEVLHHFPSIVTHTYRDMPFVSSPLLWSKLSGAFYKPNRFVDRAHGDGMEIGYNSPEAFEEILWRIFWPEKYTDSGIELWGVDDRMEEVKVFMLEHMKKIIALRKPDRKYDSRYLSKNNANIARIDLIKKMFPDAKILVPVRNPIDHATSMHRQHLNFLEIHKKDLFVKRYMSDIGHYEFGELHNPISFPGFNRYIKGFDPLSKDYWVGYWIAAFEHLLQIREKVSIIRYEKTCYEPSTAISEICSNLEIPEENMLEHAISIIKRPPPAPKNKREDFDFKLISHAEQLYNTII